MRSLDTIAQLAQRRLSMTEEPIDDIMSGQLVRPIDTMPELGTLGALVIKSVKDLISYSNEGQLANPELDNTNDTVDGEVVIQRIDTPEERDVSTSNESIENSIDGQVVNQMDTYVTEVMKEMVVKPISEAIIDSFKERDVSPQNEFTVDTVDGLVVQSPEQPIMETLVERDVKPLESLIVYTSDGQVVIPRQKSVVDETDGQVVSRQEDPKRVALVGTHWVGVEPPEGQEAEAQVEALIHNLLETLEPLTDIEPYIRPNHLLDAFRLDDKCLGAGLSGPVVRGIDGRDGREYAIKMHFIVGKEDTWDGLLGEFHRRHRELTLWRQLTHTDGCLQYYDSWV
ncbi:unnamed protein product, partial [Oppiella nova]